MINYASNKSTAIFVEQLKEILIEASCIADKVGHSTKKDETIKGIKIDTILFRKKPQILQIKWNNKMFPGLII